MPQGIIRNSLGDAYIYTFIDIYVCLGGRPPLPPPPPPRRVMMLYIFKTSVSTWVVGLTFKTSVSAWLVGLCYPARPVIMDSLL